MNEIRPPLVSERPAGWYETAAPYDDTRPLPAAQSLEEAATYEAWGYTMAGVRMIYGAELFRRYAEAATYAARLDNHVTARYDATRYAQALGAMPEDVVLRGLLLDRWRPSYTGDVNSPAATWKSEAHAWGITTADAWRAAEFGELHTMAHPSPSGGNPA